MSGKCQSDQSRLKMIDAVNKLYLLCRLSKAYPRHPSSSKPAASKRRSITGTNPDEKEKSSASCSCEIGSPKSSEIKIDARTDSGIISINIGIILGAMSLGLKSRFAKSFFMSEFFDIKIIASEIINGAINPGSIRIIYSPP